MSCSPHQEHPGAEGICPPEETRKLRLISPLISFNLASSKIQKRGLPHPQAHQGIITGQKSSTSRDLPLASCQLSRFQEWVTCLFFVSGSAKASSSRWSVACLGLKQGRRGGSKTGEQSVVVVAAAAVSNRGSNVTSWAGRRKAGMHRSLP